MVYSGSGQPADMSYMLLVPHTDAATLAEASFNDPRCEDGGVCPADPLLFTCNVTDTPATIVIVRFSFVEIMLISLRADNTTEGVGPDGINIQSRSVTGENPYNYILTLSIANASLLNGGMIECDSVIGVTDMDRCPVAGELIVYFGSACVFFSEHCSFHNSCYLTNMCTTVFSPVNVTTYTICQLLVLGDPGPPLNLIHNTSANTVSSAVITWDPPSTTGGGDGISITGYRIMSSDNGLNLDEVVDDMTYTITGLLYNTNYSVNVRAINSCGQESGPDSVVVYIEARG